MQQTATRASDERPVQSLSARELLDDPLVRLLMKADRVDPADLLGLLGEVEQRLQRVPTHELARPLRRTSKSWRTRLLSKSSFNPCACTA
jgi:hypothetical protein